ncbi:uncharacterized protein LOC117650663 isoform X2 [Thrips palmi]|nr:uncharacterized protein LOC117650663 isoform X2 [Thrips palmi]
MTQTYVSHAAWVSSSDFGYAASLSVWTIIMVYGRLLHLPDQFVDLVQTLSDLLWHGSNVLCPWWASLIQCEWSPHCCAKHHFIRRELVDWIWQVPVRLSYVRYFVTNIYMPPAMECSFLEYFECCIFDGVSRFFEPLTSVAVGYVCCYIIGHSGPPEKPT